LKPEAFLLLIDRRYRIRGYRHPEIELMMHSTIRMPARRLLSTALVSCLMLAAAPNVMAQSANASLRGQVAGAQAGSEVTATNVATGTVRRGTVRADGTYSLMGLDPGTYDVAANGQTQKVTVTVASTSTLNFSEAAAGGSSGGSAATNLDTVNVVAPTLLQEVRTSEVGKTVSLQQIQTTPQVSRNFLEFADAVPGMIFTRDRRIQGHQRQLQGRVRPGVERRSDRCDQVRYQ